MYAASSVKWEREKGLTREEFVSLVRLRTGHSTDLNSYMAKLEPSKSEKCRRCESERENLEHVMECVAGTMKRWELGITDMSDLVCRPRESLDYWKWWRRQRPKDPERA